MLGPPGPQATRRRLLSLAALLARASPGPPPGQAEPPGLLATLGRHHAKSIYALAFSPGGGLLATGSRDRTVALWNASRAVLPDSRGRPPRPARRLEGHAGGVTAVGFVVAGGELLLASGGAGDANGTGGELRLWSAGSGELLQVLEHPKTVFGVAAPPCDPSAEWAELAAGAPGHGAGAAGPDCEVATACWDGVARIFDLPSGVLKARLPGHEGGLYSVAYSPLDPSLIATSSADRTVRIWDLRDQRPLWVLRHRDHVTSVDWSPRDPLTLATGGWDRRFRLWEIGKSEAEACRRAGGQCSDALAARSTGRHPQLVWRVAFAPSGELVAACHGAVGQSPTVVLYNVDTGRVVRRLGRHKDTPLVVGWSPDGLLLASAGMDQKVLIYDGRSPLDDIPGGDPDDAEEQLLWRGDLEELRTGVPQTRRAMRPLPRRPPCRTR
ncbi:unnamed protein product [Prorocentrum cordatum]|uniref:Uncharacterized protein n=1 Tax=Prorocentrum cordatum TaxID=2364126 RepID=A0ABN9RQ04_9DINO|nr:unnamed protein product [Polarella glacialis]